MRSSVAPEQCGAWLRKVAVTTSLDLVRRREARTRAEAERSIAREASAPENTSPATRASTAEFAAELELALRDLPEGQRTVFLLRHRGGLALRSFVVGAAAGLAAGALVAWGLIAATPSHSRAPSALYVASNRGDSTVATDFALATSPPQAQAGGDLARLSRYLRK